MPRSPHRPTRRLRLECLEDRCTPATLTVTTLTDSAGVGSLRQAIFIANDEASNPGPDTIVFAPGLFAAGDANLPLTAFDTGTDADEFGPSALRITSDVTIRGPGGENGLTILRKSSDPNEFRLFYVFNSATPASAKLQLENLTLSGGRAHGFTGGGGSAGMGGAIYNRLGAVTMTNTTLSANLALGGAGAAGAAFNFGGGGVAAVGSSGGAAGGGVGGFPHGGGAPGTSYEGGFGGGGSGGGGATAGGHDGGFGGGGGSFVGDVFKGGNGGFGGGGGGTGNGFLGTGGFGGGNGADRTGATGSGNSGGGGGLGGAIFNQGGTVSIINSTLTLNVARGGSATAPALPGGGFGGGVFNLNGTLSVINSTIAGNIIGNGNGGAGGAEGGAVYNLSFAAQATGDFAGGPATPATTAAVTVANSILAKTSGGSDVFNSGAAATIAAPGPNIVSVAVTNAGGATATGTPFTVADPALGVLQDNGGPTFTQAPTVASPAIDAGSSAAAAGLTFDQRGPGFGRISGVLDIGAVELQREPLAVSGSPDARATLFTASAAGAYGTPLALPAVFGTNSINVRTATGDVNGDGFVDTVLVTGPGAPIRLAVISGKDNTTVLVAPFDPFGGDFTGGGFVSAADIDDDGKAEFVVTPDQGGGPRVTIFSQGTGTTATQRANFFGIDDASFRGGARAAVGDINGDGTADLAVAAGFQGGPRTALFDGKTVFGTPTRLIGDFFGFPGADATTLRNGVFLALGDVDGDGKSDLILGGGPGGAPRVFILSGAKLAANDVAGAQATPIANFFVANNTNDRGGVRLAAKNADGDAKADVVVGSGEGSPSRARVYLGKNFTGGAEPATFQDLDPFAATLAGGVFVG